MSAINRIFLLSIFLVSCSSQDIVDEIYIDNRIEEISMPVVRVRADRIGTGVVIGSDEHDGTYLTSIISCSHIFNPNTYTSVVDIFQWEDGKVVGSYPVDGFAISINLELDLSLILVILDEEHPSISLASDEEFKSIKRFDPVYVSACPLGYEVVQHKGEIIDLSFIQGDANFTVISAFVYSGSSGGPVLSKFGDTWKMIGTVYGMVSDPNTGHSIGGINMITTVQTIRSFIPGEECDIPPNNDNRPVR